MVKLNYKTAIPIKGVPPLKEKLKATPEPEMPPPAEEESLKLEEAAEVVEETSQVEEVEETFEMEEIDTSSKKTTGKSKEFRFKEDIFQESVEVFDDRGSSGFKKTFIIIVFVIAILGGGGFFLYKFTGIFNNLPFISKPPTTTEKPIEVESPAQDVKTPPAATQSKPASTPASSPMLPIWQKNMGNNQFVSSNLERIMSQKSSFSRFSLIILTPNEINLTILSDSPDKIARFKDDLNKATGQINFRTIDTQEKNINRSRLIFADLSAQVPAGYIRPALETPQRGIPSDNLKNDVSTLSRKHKIKLDYFKAGKSVSGAQFTQHYYYINISGSRDGTLSFLKELTSTFPAIQINKIAVNPTNLVTYSDNSLFIRINFLYMN